MSARSEICLTKMLYSKGRVEVKKGKDLVLEAVNLGHSFGCNGFEVRCHTGDTSVLPQRISNVRE